MVGLHHSAHIRPAAPLNGHPEPPSGTADLALSLAFTEVLMRPLCPALLLCLAALPAPAQFFERLMNPTVEVQLTHPPELGLRITRLAFGQTTTREEDELVSALIADLSGSGEMEILDRANVDRILREQKFSNSGLVDEKTAVELGRLIGSPVLLFVKVHHFSISQVPRKESSTKKEKDKEVTITTWYAKTQGDIVATIQAVDLATGRIYSARRVVATPSKENSSKEGQPEYPAQGLIRELALEQVRAQVRRLLLPWTETRKLVFYDDSDYGMKDAHQRLKLKDTPGALVRARESLAKVKADPAAKSKYAARAHYNVGMCLFIQGDYEGALPFLRTARDQDTDSGIFREAFENCSRGVQLAEDMRKATARGQLETGAAPPLPVKAPEGAKPSLEERLERLEALRKKGLITDEEYRKRREEILKEI